MELLRRGLDKIMAYDDEKIGQFKRFMDLMLEYNEKVNLTAITEENEIIEKHFLDSVLLFNGVDIKENSTMIDVGTGAGFPSIPIKILRPDIDMTLLDSLKKRVDYLDLVIDELNLDGIWTVHGRSEDFGQDKDYREKFDYSISRAVASMNVLLEYCLPFVKVGGCFIALKGKNVYEEIEESKNALEVLGGKVLEVKELIIPNTDLKRYIVVVEKVAEMNEKYPRKAGKVTKKPL